MNPAEILQVLEQRGAVLHGHFRLSSGRHSDLFVQKFRVFEHPGLAQRFGDSIAERFAGEFELVAAPAVGAVVLGFATALAADARFVFSERVDGEMSFRRGFQIGARQRTLVVEDVVTTGASAREVVDLVSACGGRPVGVAALIDRSDAQAPPTFGVPFRSLVKIQADSWEQAGCPLCRRNEPVTDPGSRRLQG